jgi:hypothetical protein
MHSAGSRAWLSKWGGLQHRSAGFYGKFVPDFLYGMCAANPMHKRLADLF